MHVALVDASVYAFRIGMIVGGALVILGGSDLAGRDRESAAPGCRRRVPRRRARRRLDGQGRRYASSRTLGGRQTKQKSSPNGVSRMLRWTVRGRLACLQRGQHVGLRLQHLIGRQVLERLSNRTGAGRGGSDCPDRRERAPAPAHPRPRRSCSDSWRPARLSRSARPNAHRPSAADRRRSSSRKMRASSGASSSTIRAKAGWVPSSKFTSAACRRSSAAWRRSSSRSVARPFASRASTGAAAGGSSCLIRSSSLASDTPNSSCISARTVSPRRARAPRGPVDRPMSGLPGSIRRRSSSPRETRRQRRRAPALQKRPPDPGDSRAGPDRAWERVPGSSEDREVHEAAGQAKHGAVGQQ